MDRSKVPAVLSIAGSDSSGGAGIQADIKTITAHRLYAETAITAITAQNTLGVTAVQNISPDIVAAQIDAVFDDIRPNAVKIGMVSSAEIIEVIADRLSAWNAQNIVVDPVMVATSGARLIAEDAAERSRVACSRWRPSSRPTSPRPWRCSTTRSIPSAPSKTLPCSSPAALAARPSLRAGILSTRPTTYWPNPRRSMMRQPPSDPLTTWFRHKRIETDNTHGTGCTLSSAIACALAQGMDLADAINAGKAYLTGALAAGLNMGKGSGPVNHMWQY